MAKQDKESIERRKKLSDGLRSLPHRKFHLGSWVTIDGDPFFFGRIGKKEKCKLVDEKDCGTTACVAGWCPVFFQDEWTWSNDGAPQLRGFRHRGSDQIRDAGPSIRSFAKFFGLSIEEATEVCIPNENPYGHNATAKECAKLIDGFTEKKKPNKGKKI